MLMTQEQHDAAVVHVLAIVDKMIALHEERRHERSHYGLCLLADEAVADLYRRAPGRLTLHISMSALMARHIRPPGEDVWWFGSVRNPLNWHRRRDALQVLRAKVAAGDIHPNPPGPYGEAHDNNYALAA